MVFLKASRAAAEGLLSLTTAAVVLATAFLILTTGASLAEPASRAKRGASAEALTHKLVALDAAHRRSERAARPAILDELLAIAAERQQLLASLIDEDPAQVLRVALPARLRASLPAAARPYLEENVMVEGELEAVYEDSEHSTRLRYSLKARDGRFSLHFAKGQPALPSGARIRVEGVDFQGALALASSETSVETLELPAPPVTADEKRAIVLLVNFSDNPTEQPYSLDEAYQTVFGTTSDFLLENSFGQASLTGEVAGWYTLPLATGCSGSQIASAANQAAGIDPSAYDSVIYVFPRNSSCGWAGMATVGGNPGKVWINGYLTLQVVGHELGHNMGLYHSHGLECGDVRTASDCQNVEYGDRLDIMGFSRGHFSAFQKQRLSWLGAGPALPIADIDTEGTYLLEAYESALGTGAKALRILKSVDPVTGRRSWYYLEYRQAIGFDDFLAYNANVLNGVLIRTATEASGNSSFLLDMTPASGSGTTDFLDSALVVGDSYSSPDGDLTITTEWTDGNEAAVTVSIASEPCAHADPSLSLSPSESQWVEPGTPVTYTLSVTNHDDETCGTSPFALETSVPAGWSADLGTASIMLAPGATASTTLDVSSPATTADGFYAVDVTAHHGAAAGRAVSASATYVVASGSANGAPVARDDSGSASQGVPVTLDVLANDTDPENDQLMLTGVTQGSRGSVVINADSTVTYTSGSNAGGNDSFRYTITDGSSSATATVSIRLEKQSRGKRGGKPTK